MNQRPLHLTIGMSPAPPNVKTPAGEPPLKAMNQAASRWTKNRDVRFAITIVVAWNGNITRAPPGQDNRRHRAGWTMPRLPEVGRKIAISVLPSPS